MNSFSTDDQPFSRLAGNWWDPNGELKTLHVINPTRLKYTDHACQLTNKHVLDIGCGGGIFSEAMARKNAIVTGIEISEEVINAAREHAATNQIDIEYISTTAEAYLQQTDKKFDVITCLELLEHVPDPESVVQSMASLLRPGGDIILSTINRGIDAYIKSILIAEHLTGLIPKNTHSYSQFIKPSELSGLLRKNGFKVMDITGLKYIPFLDYVSLTDDLSVNYLLHARLEG
ncbi:MAG: bifunctional 2-polyprenyl-6-hydroxyphenol methylase/3-demethylubiquinol 3-O-methyltransferase UbiG [Gammaproteobacteria bacterium]|nr:bifunctional 2-polyprenyl-6-hydroxyphenol methylase/3-demethylubiquinol 3-O-methyltransferase UbiG [Gammaproteobacteria bacterium]